MRTGRGEFHRNGPRDRSVWSGVLDVIGLGVLLLIGLALGVVLTTWATVRMLTRPPRRGYAFAVARSMPGDPSELARPLEFSEWNLESRGLAIKVWDIGGEDPAGPIVVCTHGWGESRVIALQRVPALAAAARRVVVWDLPGHGDSQGRCTLGTREIDDVCALVTRVAEAGVPIVLAGSSLGAGVSIAAAGRLGEQIAGVIAEAPYRVPIVPARNVLRPAGMPYRVSLPLAMAAIGWRLGFGSTWAKAGNAGGFDRAEHAARLGCPLLVLHGDRDAVCPVEDGRAVAAANRQAKFVQIDGAEHLNLWAHPEYAARCEAEVAEFLRGVGSGRR